MSDSLNLACQLISRQNDQTPYFVQSHNPEVFQNKWQVFNNKHFKINFNNKIPVQKAMSRCHFPHENRTIILDIPSLSHISSTMLLIETSKNICYSSTLSLSCFERLTNQQDAISEEDSLGLLIQEESQKEIESNYKKKKNTKTGCTCKKTNCLKMYCQCFSTGKMCTPECACYGCSNKDGYEEHIQVAKEQLKLKGSTTNRHTYRTCNCKKSQCQKKYCECFNSGSACTEACNCSDCCNKEGCDVNFKDIHQGNSEEESINN